MKKRKTTGKIGESIIKSILIENNINHSDLTNQMIEKEIEERFIINGREVYQKYKQKYQSHPFDFIINNKSFEIKTSNLDSKGFFNFNLVKNNLDIIDFIIGVIVDNSKLKYFYVFDKKFFQGRAGLKYNVNNNKFPKLDERLLITFLKNI